VRDIKAGKDRVTSPVYSHVLYDIVPGETTVVEQPDIVIVEGLNVLQMAPAAEGALRVFVSDYFDFTIYVDAAADDIRSWYVERFLALRHTAFRDPAAYFHRYAGLSDTEAAETAERIWADINEPNLVANILPTRERADLVLRKGRDHAVEEVWLRKL
jgi:type I pantothenate kinase